MIADYLYKHPRYFLLFFLSIITVGLTSFNTIPRQEDPSITNFLASITTFYPGATPDRVEALVTIPLEDELKKIAEIDQIRSVSRTGVSYINIRLLDTLPEESLERLWSEVRDAIGDATNNFPAGVSEPSFEDEKLSSFSNIVAISSKSDHDVPLGVLHRYALDLADRASNMPGTKFAELFGEPQEEIRVDINSDEMFARGLSIRTIAQSLAAADSKSAAGKSTGAGSDLLIEVDGEFDSLERIRRVVVNSSNSNNSTTTINDLGSVYKTAISPPQSMVIAQGRAAILIGIASEDAQQVDVWSASMRQLINEFIDEAPRGLNIEITYDQSDYATKRLVNVAINLALGVTLVIIVMLFTLGWRAAVVVAVMLPLSGLLSITIMERIGMALHQMSIAGLIVSLGLLVDGAIVMTDEVRKRLKRGLNPLQAIRGSVHRLRIPLLASATTTVLTFLPMAIITGPAGDFVGSIAKSVIIMLSVSTLLALTITPILASWLLPKGDTELFRWTTRGINSGRAGKWLESAMDWSLRNPLSSVALALILPVTGFLSFSTLTAQFFPGSDRDQMVIQVKLADGRSIEETVKLASLIDKQLRSEAEIRRVDWVMGESAPAFYYNLVRNKQGIPSYAEALVLTENHRITDALIQRLQKELDRDFPQARILIKGIDQGPPVSAPVEVEIIGPDLGLLQSLGEQLRHRMEKIAFVTHTNADLVGGAPKLVMELDEQKLRLAGLDLSDTSQALNDSLQGILSGEILESTERLPVRVRLTESEWSTSDQIENLRIPILRLPGSVSAQSQNQQLDGIALSNLGSFKLLPSQSPINRLDGERTNTVQAFLERGVLPAVALKQLDKLLLNDPLILPAGYRIQFGGDADERQRVISKLLAPLGIILSLLVITIVMTFNSWRLSAIAGLVCICSLGLSFLALAIFQYPFGINAVIGVIGSIGVSINAAIIILTALKQNAEACEGHKTRAREIVMDSSRHIISTTITTFGGFLPLMLGGDGFWPPFAMAIAGGVLLSTIISFFLVPPMFIFFSGFKSFQVSPTRDTAPETLSAVTN